MKLISFVFAFLALNFVAACEYPSDAQITWVLDSGTFTCRNGIFEEYTDFIKHYTSKSGAFKNRVSQRVERITGSGGPVMTLLEKIDFKKYVEALTCPTFGVTDVAKALGRVELSKKALNVAVVMLNGPPRNILGVISEKALESTNAAAKRLNDQGVVVILIKTNPDLSVYPENLLPTAHKVHNTRYDDLESLVNGDSKERDFMCFENNILSRIQAPDNTAAVVGGSIGAIVAIAVGAAFVVAGVVAKRKSISNALAPYQNRFFEFNNAKTGEFAVSRERRASSSVA